MKKLLVLICCITFVFTGCLSGCSQAGSANNETTGSQENNGGNKENTAPADDDGLIESVVGQTGDPEDMVTVDASGNFVNNTDTIAFSCAEAFNKEAFDLQILLPAGMSGEIRYTTNGKEPTKESELYEKPIRIEAKKRMFNYPVGTVISAKAFYDDGTESSTIVRTYFAGEDFSRFFTGYVFLIAGDPDEITGPSGILSDNDTMVPGTPNYDVHGDISERKAHVEVISQDGEKLINQFCGVKVHGAYNRRNEVKSLKLSAKKAYDPEHGSFKYNFFGATDWNGKPIEKYDKIVLRSHGNDFGQAYIRDELNQRLAAQAGFELCEAVVPAYVYLNGKFYNYTWLHESYCNKYLQNKFPDDARAGKFIVIEGSDPVKKYDDDGGDEEYVDEFNAMYNEYSSSELTDDRLFELNQLLDVYGYLDFFAFNCYISNFDWPQNNIKCMKYYKAAGEESDEDGVYDGRWHYMMHDMDYAEGLYWQQRTQANQNNLYWIMTDDIEMERSEWWGMVTESSTETNRYSALFTRMMQRRDLRDYFIKQVLHYGSTVLTPSNIKSTLADMRKEQAGIDYYTSYLKERYGRDVFYSGSEDLINQFAGERMQYMIRFMGECFGLDEDTIRSMGK